ncbi:MAG: hypothetical protein GY765_10895 [bacterium]|nr:hypothetical protein [bacterium]
MKKFLICLVMVFTLVGSFSTFELVDPPSSEAMTLDPFIIDWMAQVYKCNDIVNRCCQKCSEAEKQMVMEECMSNNGY